MTTAAHSAKASASPSLTHAVEELELEEVRRVDGDIEIAERAMSGSVALDIKAPSAAVGGGGGQSPRDDGLTGEDGTHAPSHTHGKKYEAVLLWVALGGALILTAFIGVLGYEIVDPIFVFAYLMLLRRWSIRSNLLAALVMFGIAYGGVSVLHLGKPPGFSL